MVEWLVRFSEVEGSWKWSLVAWAVSSCPFKQGEGI